MNNRAKSKRKCNSCRGIGNTKSKCPWVNKDNLNMFSTSTQPSRSDYSQPIVIESLDVNHTTLSLDTSMKLECDSMVESDIGDLWKWLK